MVVEVAIICATVITVAGLIYDHLRRERNHKVQPVALDLSVINELREEIKKVDSKITKASLNRVFQ
jgi:folate-dependent tRNA-U54 methylase TrmFO/GidA